MKNGNQEVSWKVFVSGIAVFVFLTSSFTTPNVIDGETSRPAADLSDRIDWGAQSTSGEVTWFLTKDPDSSGGLDRGFVWGVFYRAGMLDWYIHEVESASEIVIVRDSADAGMLTQLDVMPAPDDLDAGVWSVNDAGIPSEDVEDGPILADPSWQTPLRTVFVANDGIGECAVEVDLVDPICLGVPAVGERRFVLGGSEHFWGEISSVALGPWRGKLVRMEPAAFHLGYPPCTLLADERIGAPEALLVPRVSRQEAALAWNRFNLDRLMDDLAYVLWCSWEFQAIGFYEPWTCRSHTPPYVRGYHHAW